MKNFPDGTREFVIGTTGSGKTFYTVRRTENVPRMIAIDPKRTLKKDMEHDKLIDQDMGELLRYLQANEGGHFRVIYMPTPGDEMYETHEICRLLEIMQAPYRDEVPGAKKVMLIIEEAAQSVPQPVSRDARGALRIATMGREMGIDLMVVTQRPQSVDKTMREMFDGRITCFQVVGDDAIGAAAKLMNAAKDAPGKIANLRQFEHVLYENNEAKTQQPLKE